MRSPRWWWLAVRVRRRWWWCVVQHTTHPQTPSLPSCPSTSGFVTCRCSSPVHARAYAHVWCNWDKRTQGPYAGGIPRALRRGRRRQRRRWWAWRWRSSVDCYLPKSRCGASRWCVCSYAGHCGTMLRTESTRRCLDGRWPRGARPRWRIVRRLPDCCSLARRRARVGHSSLVDLSRLPLPPQIRLAPLLDEL